MSRNQGIRQFSSGVPDRSSQSGQGMTEYIIIVALVAVAAIAVFQYFGQVLRSQTAAIAKEVGGSIVFKGYTRFEKGEGIEKKQENFADEIASMVNGSK